MRGIEDRLDQCNVRRRLIAAGFAMPALASTRRVSAQGRSPIVIGWLDWGARESSIHLLMAFKEGLTSNGWKAAAHYVVEEHWLKGSWEQLPVQAQLLAAKKPHVIVAAPSSLVAAAAKAAPTTPILQVSGSPLESGLVTSLARPGGMITGVSNIAVSMSEKLGEFLREMVPKLQRVGYLIDPKTRSFAAAMDAARRSSKQYSTEAYFGEVSKPEALEPVLSRLLKDGVQALIIMPNAWYLGERQRIIKFALAHRLPLIAGPREYAEDGALLTYGADREALYRRAAYYVDRILKGAKPGDLPIEQPTKFELVINLKTARTLGLNIPKTVLVRATRVIE